MERKQATSPSVIVIGSGMAGIAAARTLFDASFQVRATIYFLYANVNKYCEFLTYQMGAIKCIS